MATNGQTNGRVAALFDIDGTLVGGASIWRGLWDYHFREKRRRDRPLRFLFANMRRGWQFARRGASREEFVQASAEAVAGFFTGLSPDEAEHVYQSVWRHTLAPGLRADVLARLAAHKEAGHLVALISATLQGLADLVAREVGADVAVGSALALADGRYTGRMLGPACFGPQKASSARDLLAARGLDLASSYAYADSGHDAALLECVGHAVAVYPDSRLHALARARGWEVLGQPRG
ncbi:MAG: HAD family hydrolase [Chloroflexota bacterium]